MKKLTPRQIMFCQKYIENGLNATKAYMASGFKVKSEAEGRACASRLLTNANVCSYISLQQAELRKASLINAERIINELSKLAFSSLSAVVEIDEEGCLKIRKDADLNLVKQISTSSSPGSSSISVTAIDRLKAIDMLCKILGIYETHERYDPDRSKTLRDAALRVLEIINKKRNTITG